MASGIGTFIYPVKDLDRAKALFRDLLGTAPYVDEPYYVGFRVQGVEIGLDPHGHKHGTTSYWHVADIQASLKQLLDAGAEMVQELRDVGGGRRTAVVRDADGNIIGLHQEG